MEKRLFFIFMFSLNYPQINKNREQQTENSKSGIVGSKLRNVYLIY